MYVSAKEWRELQNELLSQRQQYADLQVRVMLQAQIHNKIVPILQQFDNLPGRYEFMVRINKLHQANRRLDFLLELLADPSFVSVGFVVFNKLYNHLCDDPSELILEIDILLDPENSSRHEPLILKQGSSKDNQRLLVLELEKKIGTLIYYDPRVNKFEVGRIKTPAVEHRFRVAPRKSLTRRIFAEFLKSAEPGIGERFRSVLKWRELESSTIKVKASGRSIAFLTWDRQTKAN